MAKMINTSAANKIQFAQDLAKEKISEKGKDITFIKNPEDIRYLRKLYKSFDKFFESDIKSKIKYYIQIHILKRLKKNNFKNVFKDIYLIHFNIFFTINSSLWLQREQYEKENQIIDEREIKEEILGYFDNIDKKSLYYLDYMILKLDYDQNILPYTISEWVSNLEVNDKSIDTVLKGLVTVFDYTAKHDSISSLFYSTTIKIIDLIEENDFYRKTALKYLDKKSEFYFKVKNNIKIERPEE